MVNLESKLKLTIRLMGVQRLPDEFIKFDSNFIRIRDEQMNEIIWI